MLVEKESCEKMNVGEALRFAASRFKEAGFDNPLLEAEILLCFTLSCSRSEIYACFSRVLLPLEASSYQSYIEKRLKKVPLQYITGGQSFRYLNLKIEPEVFIPRPETELLAEYVIEFVKFQKSPLVIDLGTGSGAIALSIAYEVPEARVVAVDICSKALAVASENAHKFGLENRIRFVTSDLFANFENDLKDKVDAIVSNPPYILSGEIEKLSSEVKDFEPIIALDGGEDGLSIIKRIIFKSYEFLKPGGLLAIEVGYGQASNVIKLIKETKKFNNVNILKDYSSVERIVNATRQIA